MAAELEVQEFLYTLVRLHRPSVVVESGAGKGYSTLALAGALQRNQHGYLWSYEPVEEFREIAQNRVGDIQHAIVIEGDSRDYRGDDPDMVFLDSGQATRVDEIIYWLYRRCVLVIHDAYRYVGILDRHGGVMHACPRGLWVRTPGKECERGQWTNSAETE
jgi:predicted O-methyltransferase YrrM